MQFDTKGLEGYLTNKTLESEFGVWLKFPGGRRFRVLRAGGANRRFTRAFQTAIRPHRQTMERRGLDVELSDQIMREVYSKHVVIDWEGIKDADGNEVPYSPGAAIQFFAVVPELFAEIATLAQNMATFSQETVEEAKKELGEA